MESATSAFSRYDVRPNMLPAITVCAADSIRVNADIDNAVAMAMMTLRYFISFQLVFLVLQVCGTEICLSHFANLSIKC